MTRELFTIKGPDGEVSPFFIGNSKSDSVGSYTNCEAIEPLDSYEWERALKRGFSVVPVRVTLEEIKE